MLRRKLSPRPRIVPIPWLLLQSASLAANLANKLIFHGRAKLPGLLVPARLAARCNPYRYDNGRMKSDLGFSPRFTLAEGIERSIAGASCGVVAEPARKAAA
jgi:nucleoside-diphosphate-sugar epimerase